MALGPAYGGDGTGTGFQLFTKTADGMPAIFTGVDRTAAESARDVYFGANPGDLATMDANSFLLIQLIDESTDPDTSIFQQRQSSAWVDVQGIVPVSEGGNFAQVTDGRIPVDSSGSLFVNSPLTVDQTDSRVISDTSIELPQSSLKLGEVVSISEGLHNIIISDSIDGDIGFPVLANWETAGTDTPSFINLGAQFSQNIQIIDTTTITANPLNFSVTATVVSPDVRQFNQLTFRTGAAMNNVRVQIIDNASGVVIEYIPNRAACVSGTGGLNFILGDNIVNLVSDAPDSPGVFNIGISPLRLSQGQQIDVVLEADSVNILGNVSNIPYLVALAQDGPPTDVLITGDGIQAPGTTVLNSFAFWDSTDGSSLGNTVGATITEGGGILSVVYQSPSPTGLVLNQFRNSSSGVVGTVQYSETSSEFSLTTGSSTDFVINSIGTATITSSGSAALTSSTASVNLSAATTASLESLSGTSSIVANGGNVILNAASAATHIQLSATNSTVLTPVVELTNSVTGFNIFVSSGSPEGVITGDPGDICFTINGTSSRIFQLESATSSNTGWAPSGGTIDGPATSTNNSIPTWSGTSGDLLQDNVQFRYIAAGNARTLEIESPNTSGDLSLDFLDSGSLSSLLLSFSESTGTGRLICSTGDLDISSQAGDVEILFSLASSVFIVDGQVHPDTDEIFRLDTGGSNGAIINFHTGTRNPEGLVTATPGSYYYRRSGTNSNTYQLRSASNANTPWVAIGAAGGGDVVGPGTTVTDNSMLTWNGTTGTLVQEVSGAILTEDTSNVTLSLAGSLTSTNNQFRLLTSVGATAWEVSRPNDTGTTTIQNLVGPFTITNTTANNFNIMATTGAMFIETAVNQTILFQDFIRMRNTGTIVEVRPRSPSVSGFADICLEPSAGGDALRIRYDENNNESSITNFFGDLTIQTNQNGGNVFLHATGNFADVRLEADDGNLQMAAFGSGTEGLVEIQGDNDVLLQSNNEAVIIASGNSATDAVLEINNSTASAVTHQFVTNADANGALTGAGGDIAFRDDTDLSALYLNRAATTDTVWYQFSVNPPTIIEVNSQNDLDSLATADVITITVDTMFIFKVDVFTNTKFTVTGGANLYFFSPHERDYFFLGTGTLFTGNGTLLISGCTMVGGNAGRIFVDWEGGLIELIDLRDCTIAGFDMGTLSRASGEPQGPQMIISNVRIVNFGDTFVMTDVFFLAIDNLTINTIGAIPSVNVPFIEILDNLTEEETQFDFQRIGGRVLSGESFVRIDPRMHTVGRVSVISSPILGTLFDISGGSTGTFTAVADASFTGQAITSVTDSSGIARFNFTPGPTLFINQNAVISGFTTNTGYNGTFPITATGAGFFECDRITFGTDETGSFASNSITLTDTGTALVDGDTLVLDTDDSTDYDGGAIVYNQLTNTFRVNVPNDKVFTATATGSWDTSGIDQKNAHVLASFNPNFEASHYIAAAYVNNNATANGAIVNNTFTDMVFGTGGSALIEGSTIERWKLIDEINGTFEYTGNEEFDDSIQFDFTCVSTGGSVDFRFRWQIDTGSGFGDLPDAVEALVNVGSDAQSVTKKFPLRATKGDQIKPEITRNSGSSGITTTYATIFAGR